MQTSNDILQKEEADNRQRVLVLLDAHAILHRSFHALPPLVSPAGEPTGAVYGFTAMIIKIIRELKPDYLVACYDLPEPTFRKIAYTDYKAHRPKMDDELIGQIEKSRDVLRVFDIPICEFPGFEADDVIGTIVEKTRNEKNFKIIIASGDLDTLQLVQNDRVIVYILSKGTEAVFYNEDAVEKRYGFSPALLPDYKGLRGDPSDNIPGVSGIGEKTAGELIKSFGFIENIYSQIKKNSADLSPHIKPRIYTLLKENEESAFSSKALAVIRRDAPIDFNLKEAAWAKVFNTEKIEFLFKKMGFKSLLERFYKVIGNQAQEEVGDQAF